MKQSETTAATRSVRMAALAALLLAAVAFFVIAAQPRVNQWGATDRERHGSWPGDEIVNEPAFVWTNAITIDRPADAVWPWVAQLGQGRGGLYSYDWLENLMGCGVHSADRILPQYQQRLRVGDLVIRMCRYAPHNPVALFEPGRALVLGGPDETSTWAFIVEPVRENTSRLIVRSRGEGMATRMQGPIQFVMQRRMMQGIKDRAEGRAMSTIDNLEPALWLLAGGLFLASAVLALLQRERWWQRLAVAACALAAMLWLMFWQPPVRVGAMLVGALALALWGVGLRRTTEHRNGILPGLHRVAPG